MFLLKSFELIKPGFLRLLFADEAQNLYTAFAEFNCKVHRDAFLKFDFTINGVKDFLGKIHSKSQRI